MAVMAVGGRGGGRVGLGGRMNVNSKCGCIFMFDYQG